MVVNHKASNSKNLLGMEVHIEDEAYKLYNDYATRTRFCIRKDR